MARVLIVDDEPDVLFLLEANLAAFGHDGVTTSDLDEARGLLRDESFAALILDVSMPDTDGPTFLREIRGAGLAPEHVFLVSAIPSDQLEAMAEANGAIPVPKPFTSAILRAALTPALGPE